MIENIESFTFNGVDIADEFTNEVTGEYLIVNSVSGRGLLPAAPNLITVTRRHGAYFESSYLPERILDITLTLKSESFPKLRKDLERLNEIINTGEEGEIVFADEPDRVYYGTVAEVSSEMEISHIAAISFVFVCADPFKYGQEKPITFPSSGILTFENEGTAETEPIIELTAKDKATFAMVSNHDGEYNLIGKPADDDVEVVDEKTKVYELNNMNGWSSAGIVQDNRFGLMTGTMQHDGTGMRPNNFGNGDKVHGPAVTRELPEAIQDFEIEVIFDVISERDIDNFRLQIDLFDENMQKIGMLAIKDNNRFENIRVGLGRVGPYRGGGISNGYLIGEDNYTKTFGANTLLHMKFKREGDKFDLQIGRWRVNRLQDVSKESLVTDLYNGRLKYIQVAIGSFGDRAKPARLRINKIDVIKLSKATVDQTPYILDVDDVVTFDHKTKDILLNGESRKDLKNFGGSFFALEKGTNTLTISPEGAFEASIKYRNKYL